MADGKERKNLSAREENGEAQDGRLKSALEAIWEWFSMWSGAPTKKAVEAASVGDTIRERQKFLEENEDVPNFSRPRDLHRTRQFRKWEETVDPSAGPGAKRDPGEKDERPSKTQERSGLDAPPGAEVGQGQGQAEDRSADAQLSKEIVQAVKEFQAAVKEQMQVAHGLLLAAKELKDAAERAERAAAWGSGPSTAAHGQ